MSKNAAKKIEQVSVSAPRTSVAQATLRLVELSKEVQQARGLHEQEVKFQSDDYEAFLAQYGMVSEFA